MTLRTSAIAVAAFGVLTAFAVVLGLGTVAGLMALLQLGFLVGAPVALVLQRSLRSWPVSAVIASAVSLAISALAAQSLVWFEFATPTTIVIAATLYGLSLAWLLDSMVDEASAPIGEAGR